MAYGVLDIRHVLQLAVFAIVVSCAVGCEGLTRLDGRVVDSEGQPIADARVLFGENQTATSGDGRFRCQMSHAPFEIQIDLTVSKKGFETYRETFTSRSDSFYRDIVLRKYKGDAAH